MADDAAFKLYLEMACDNVRRERYAEALEQCDLALAIYPLSPEAHFLRGTCLHRLSRLQQALEAMQTAADNGLPQAQQYAAAYRDRIEANKLWVGEDNHPFFYNYFIDWLLDRIMDFLVK